MIVKQFLYSDHRPKYLTFFNFCQTPIVFVHNVTHEREYVNLAFEETMNFFSNNIDNTSPPLLVIDSLAEAPAFDDFKFLGTLWKMVPNLQVLHLSSGKENSKPKYTVLTDHSLFFWPLADRWANNFSYHATHHFISLARIPKPHRVKFTNEMLNRQLQDHGYFSIGSAKECSIWKGDYTLGFSKENQQYFPTILDGIVESGSALQYSLQDPRITDALINVVLESSYESISDHPHDQLVWRVPFITEKTVKAFAIGQVPLILGPAGQLKWIRDLGFDLFDDIIDQNHDLELDPHQRIIKFTNSLADFIKSYPKSQLQSLKTHLLPRFQHNLYLAKKQQSFSLIEKLGKIVP